ncbi:MAG: vancomycin resistance histidine kinase VanS, partial [Firmicutes bacterium]|nr:vancomycin resistance histidine kinase VanS [Bacillota bacterium]
MKSSVNDYSKLKKKIFIQMLLITSIAVATVFFLRSSVRGRFGERVAWFLENTFRLNPHDANRIYYYIFGRNIELFMFITIIVFLILLFRFSISWFTRYFDEIIAVMNKLVEESEEEITMSPELDFMEKNLNQIKNTL